MTEHNPFANQQSTPLQPPKSDIGRLEEKIDYIARRMEQILSIMSHEDAPTIPLLIHRAMMDVDIPMRASTIYQSILQERPNTTRPVFNEMLRRMVTDGRVRATPNTPEGRLYYLDHMIQKKTI